MTVKISVIIPVYNVEKYIKECLESVINQTFKDIEILCVDDCGLDNSIAVAEEYAKKDERIKIIHHDKNKGLAISRNTGIENATGDYIFFLDSDDYILPDALEKLYTKLCETDADVTIIKTNTFADDNSQEILKRAKEQNEYFNSFMDGIYQCTTDNYMSVSKEKTPVTSWGKLFRKQFLLNNHLYFINKKVIHEDVGFWFKVCSCFPKLVYIDSLGLMYRICKGSIISTNSKNKSKQHLILSVKDAFDYFKKYRKEYAEELITQIKNSDYYSSCFEKEFLFFYRIRWRKDNKAVSVLGIPVFREKTDKNNKKVIRIVGIPVFYKK